MDSRTVRKLIENQIDSQLRAFLQPAGASLTKDRFTDVVVLAGNGLTRLSGYALGVEDQSWEKSVSTAWRDTGTNGSFEALRRQGKSLPEIFNILMRRCIQEDGVSKSTDLTRKAWRSFWESVQRAELLQLNASPNTLHYNILDKCKAVITTNYDRMFEAAFVGQGKQTAKYWVPAELLPDNSTSESLWRHGTDDKSKVIYKLHGTFLEPTALTDATTLRDAIKNFDQWWDVKDYQKMIAQSETYQQLAYEMPSDKFVIQFNPVLDLLNSQTTIIACIGLGLGGEEHVINRLLSHRIKNPAPILKLNIASPLDLDPGESMGIRPINVDMGLAYSSQRRYIATVTFLSCLFKAISWEGEANEFSALIEIPDPRSNSVWPKVGPVATSVPLAVAFGQTTVNRVIGLSESPTQEHAFQAAMGTLAPGDHEKIVELHTLREIGGRSVVPCIVWDGLRMPSMLVSSVGDDELGDFALRELGKTQYVNFDQVHQIVSEDPDSPARTDHLTVVTWKGLRSIFENKREVHSASYTRKPFNARRLQESRECAQLVYLTKVGWNDWKDWEPWHDPKIVVFDTGGGPCPDQTTKVSALKGIVIASALAGVGEIMLKSFEKEEKPEVFWTNRFDFDKCTEDVILTAPKDGTGLVNEMTTWRKRMLPADEHGRSHQNLWFLHCVKEKAGLIKEFLEDKMTNSPAYAVTLGEHGIVYWVRSMSGWIGPLRVWVDKVELPESEVRSGLECGDCTRGGISAALIALSNGRTLEPRDYEVAFAFGAWCGTTKLRFFRLWDYHRALREQAPHLLRQVTDRAPTLFGNDLLELPLQKEELGPENLIKLIDAIKSDIAPGK